jgi:hypothetical protein
LPHHHWQLHQPSYESIATVTVGSGGSATIEFTSIPATYTHLQLRGLGRNTAGSAGGSNIELQFNTDTATNYSSHYLRGSGSAASAGAYTTSSRIYFIETIARNGNTAGVFGTLRCYETNLIIMLLLTYKIIQIPQPIKQF